MFLSDCDTAAADNVSSEPSFHGTCCKKLIQRCLLLGMLCALFCPACSSKEHELAVAVQRPMDGNLGRSATPLAGSRASFAAVPRGSVGPGSYAGTATTAVTAGGRPGSGAKSGMSGVSGVSGAKSKARLRPFPQALSWLRTNWHRWVLST